MKWIVMQVARDKKPSNTFKMHAATAPLWVAKQNIRGRC
jgi:hypothetical protein